MYLAKYHPEKLHLKPANNISINNIFRDIEKLLDLEYGVLNERKRTDIVVQARTIVAMYLKECKRWNYSKIGEAFKQHRTNINHTIKSGNNRLEYEQNFKNRYKVLTSYLKSKYGRGAGWKINEYIKRF